MKKVNENTKIDWQQFIAWFNATLKQFNSPIEPLKYLTKGKKAQVQRLINDIGTKKVLFDAVVNMARSDLLNGRRVTKDFPKGFIASFPWLVKDDERLADVANGMYDNPPERVKTQEELRKEKEAERELQREKQREINKRIEEEERERMRKQREYDAAHAATPEQIKEALNGFELPPLKPNELSPRQQIFGK